MQLVEQIVNSYGVDSMIYWHWLIIAVVLVTAEILVPGAYLIWLGIASFIVAIITYIFPDTPLLLDIIIFSITSVLTILLYNTYRTMNPIIVDQPLLNRRGEQYIGRVLHLVDDMVDGSGKIKIDDNIWRVRSDQDCIAGSRVHVTGIESTTLIIEPVVAENDS